MKDQSFPLAGQVSGRSPMVRRGVSGGGGVIDFAAWVVAHLAARRTTVPAPLRPDVLAAFRAAAVQDDPARLDAFLRDLLRQKIPPAAMADVYIPALARLLGDDWLEDRATFFEVTLASSRLQSMLRAIGQAWVADAADAPANAALLLAVPPGEQHTLGAMVLLGQLRRLGISVRLAIGPGRAEMRGILANAAFNGILVSASGTVRLAQLRRFVTDLRALATGVPIVVGGQVMQYGLDVAAISGADAGAADLTEALCACGVRQDGNSAQRRA